MINQTIKALIKTIRRIAFKNTAPLLGLEDVPGTYNVQKKILYTIYLFTYNNSIFI